MKADGWHAIPVYRAHGDWGLVCVLLRCGHRQITPAPAPLWMTCAACGHEDYPKASWPV